MRKLKILYGYPSLEGYNNRQGVTNIRLQQIERLNEHGFDLKPFNLKYSNLFPALTFKQLDTKWRLKDKTLMGLYEQFLNEIEDCDIFYNSVGINFHPEFVQMIPQFTVFGCNDDPENSNNLSKPVAASYDMCAIGNIAEIDTYKTWGVKNVVWQPMGFTPDMYDENLTYDDILNSNRDIDLFMIIDKLSRHRSKRMDIIDKAFPYGHFYGRGWKRGYLEMGQEVNFLQRSKIGLNIHNSTGPINTRLFYLPANGVLQICDNKSHLGKVFEIGKEVVGFENINEAIELCKYYLHHEDERRIIAAEGWKRAMREYNEVEVFKRLMEKIQLFYYEAKDVNRPIIYSLNTSDKLKLLIFNRIEVIKYKIRQFAKMLYLKIQSLKK